MKKTKTSNSEYQIKAINIDHLYQVYDLGQISEFSWTLDNYKSSLLLSGNINLGIFKTNILLGFILTSTIPPEATIELIAINPDFKRKKLGTKLLKFMTEELKNKNYQQIDLEVASKNPARLFYENHGFKKYHERKKYYKNGDDANLLKLELS